MRKQGINIYDFLEKTSKKCNNTNVGIKSGYTFLAIITTYVQYSQKQHPLARTRNPEMNENTHLLIKSIQIHK
jgi:hypothetical protein